MNSKSLNTYLLVWGTLSERDGLLQLTSSIKHLILLKIEAMSMATKGLAASTGTYQVSVHQPESKVLGQVLGWTPEQTGWERLGKANVGRTPGFETGPGFLNECSRWLCPGLPCWGNIWPVTRSGVSVIKLFFSGTDKRWFLTISPTFHFVYGHMRTRWQCHYAKCRYDECRGAPLPWGPLS